MQEDGQHAAQEFATRGKHAWLPSGTLYGTLYTIDVRGRACLFVVLVPHQDISNTVGVSLPQGVPYPLTLLLHMGHDDPRHQISSSSIETLISLIKTFSRGHDKHKIRPPTTGSNL